MRRRASESLDRRIVTQTARLNRLRGEYGVALERLELRVRALYMYDSPDTLAFVLGTASFAELSTISSCSAASGARTSASPPR